MFCRSVFFIEIFCTVMVFTVGAGVIPALTIAGQTIRTKFTVTCRVSAGINPAPTVSPIVGLHSWWYFSPLLMVQAR